MALFTGRAGDPNESMRKFEGLQRYMIEQREMAAAEDIAGAGVKAFSDGTPRGQQQTAPTPPTPAPAAGLQDTSVPMPRMRGEDHVRPDRPVKPVAVESSVAPQLGAQVVGTTPIPGDSPTRSGLENDINQGLVAKANRDDVFAVETEVAKITNALRRGAGDELGSDWASRLVGYMFYDAGGEARTNQKEIGEAVTWLEQNGRQHFLNNPGDLADFQKDALAWYRHAIKGSAREGAPVQEVRGGPPRGFDNSIGLILNLEGGYVPASADDPGGETNMGITQKWSAKYLPKGTDLKNITEVQAAKILKAEYWDKINANNLDPALQLVAFDSAVNQGVTQTKKWLAEIKKAGFSDEEAAQQLLQLRFNHYEGLATGKDAATYGKYLSGWHSRLEQVESALGLRMGGARPVYPGLQEQPDPVYTPPAQTAPMPTVQAPAQTAPMPPVDPANPLGVGTQTAKDYKQAGISEPERFKVEEEAINSSSAVKPPKRMGDIRLNERELNQSRVNYNSLMDQANMQYAGGNFKKALETRALAQAAQANGLHLAQQKAINLFVNNGDGRLLGDMVSAETGMKTVFIRRDDGKWNIVQDGRPVGTGVDAASIAERSATSADKGYVERVEKARMDQHAAAAEARAKAELANLNGQWKFATEAMKQKAIKEGKISDEGGTLILHENGKNYVITPGSMSPDGESLDTGFTLTPIAGGGSSGSAYKSKIVK